jgi:hypothetical protein
MTVTGKFIADFSDFTSAVQGAVKDLGGLEAAGDEAAASMSDLGNPAAVKQTTTATKELTGATEGAGGAFASLGRQVAGALTLGALTGFASAVLDMAGDIAKVAEATGLTTDEVQRLQAVSNATSVPMETLAKASTNLTLAIGGRSDSLLAVLKELGIEFSSFAKLSQGEQFETLARAIGAVKDPADRLRLSFEAMGTAGKQSVGAMRTDIGELGDATWKMSERSIEGLNKLDTAWKNLKTSAGAIAGNLTLLIEKAGNDLGQYLSRFNLENFGESTAETLKRYADENDPTGLLRAFAAIPKAAKAVSDALPPVTLSMAELTAEEKRLKEEAEKMAPIWAAQAAELKKHAEAMIELNSAGGDWRATLDGIGGETVEGIKYYLEAGVAQGTLATAYGLTAVQVKAVAEALKEETDASKAGAAESARQMGLMTARADAYEALVQKQLTGDATTRASAQANADAAAQAYAVALSHADQYTATRLEQLRGESEAADETLRNWSATAEATMTQVKGAAEQAGEALGIVSARLGGANQGTVYAGGATFPSSESLWAASMAPGSMLGGPTLAESRMRAEMNARFNTAMASTQNAESDFWLRQIGLPSTGTGVTVQRGAVEINYPIMNDPGALDQIARLVGDAVMARITRTGAVV